VSSTKFAFKFKLARKLNKKFSSRTRTCSIINHIQGDLKMRTQIASLIVTLIATLAVNGIADAQNFAPAPQQQTQIQQESQLYVAPVLPPVQQNQYYFGMNIQLKRTWAGTTLMVLNVTPGSPAAQAGLEYGDEIRTVNGYGFGSARDSFHAVNMMNQFVNQFATSGPAPAATASPVPGQAAALTILPPTPSPLAQLVVRNVRNGQNVQVIVRPQFRGGWGAPAAAAAVVQGQ
jgi:predicted metalloprotease with PDZ domain